MKSRIRLIFLLCGPLLGLSWLHAQPASGATNGQGHTEPTAAELRLYGLVASEAEAGALLAQYENEDRQFLQERLAAYAAMQGKSAGQQLKIWRTLVDSQRDRLAKHRELERRLSYVLKQKREQQMTKKPGGGS
jgi:hypothetical protein